MLPARRADLVADRTATCTPGSGLVDQSASAVASGRATASPGAPGQDEPIQAGDLTIDLTAKIVCRDGQQVCLTPTEWSILELLART